MGENVIRAEWRGLQSTEGIEALDEDTYDSME
jgi:hypothetical protein